MDHLGLGGVNICAWYGPPPVSGNEKGLELRFREITSGASQNDRSFTIPRC